MRHLWIDTDVGIDDSLALLICLNAPNVKVIGISCVGGNASVQNVIHNTNRTLNVWGHGAEKIPIYAGCSQALLEEPMEIPDIHGADGLGCIDDAKFGINVPDRLEPEHAVNGLINAIKTYENLEILCLAPLTNIALAIKLDPRAFDRVKRIVTMGGAEDGVGNTSQWAEFNYRADAHAAAIFFRNFPASKTVMASWTLCVHHQMFGKDVDEIMGHTNHKVGLFVHDTWQTILRFTKGYLWMADPMAAFVCCYDCPDCPKFTINVVTEGEKIGMTEATPAENGVEVPKEIDMTHYRKVLDEVMDHH